MASPQTENGYTKIANEFLEAVASKLTNATWIKIILFAARITWGFHIKERESNYGAFATKTGFTKDTVKHALLDMADRKIIRFTVVSSERFLISINKDYEQWKI